MLLDFKKNGGNFGICSRNFTTKSDKSNSRVVESQFSTKKFIQLSFYILFLFSRLLLNNVTILYGQDRLFRFGDRELRSSILLLYIQNYKVI